MRNMLHRLFLMTMISSLSVFAYAVPANNSILRLESKNSAGKVVYAVASKNDNKVTAKTDTELDTYGLEYALWIVEVSGNNTFKLKNLGTGQYLAYREEGAWYESKKVYLNVDNSGVSIYEDNNHRYYINHRSTFSTSQLLIQYDPNTEYWMYYAVNGTNKNNSQSSGNWSDTTNPPSNEETSMEIPGTIVEEMFGSGDITAEDLDNIKNAVESGDLMEKLEEPEVPIVVGDDTTYPEATSGFWKTATIQLYVTYEDWTPVSFPVDVKCISDLSGVGYQYYDTEARANGEKGWVTEYITSSTKFEKGVAYHFATDSKTMTLEFKPVVETTLTLVENDFSTSLAPTGGDSLNANWYYIGNALFKNAGLSGLSNDIRYISRYDGKEWVPQENNGAYDPFDAFFVQYSGDYTMATSTSARSNAPMRDRKVVTEKYCLNIAGEDIADKTYLYFEDGASAEGYVIGEDFLSFATIGGVNTEIYTYEGDIDYSFNTRPIENTLVYVGLYIAKAGTYTISLDNISGNAETFVLYDNYEQDFVRLHLGETYTFYSERGEFNDRFGVAVTYAPEVPTDNISLSANKLIVVNNEIQGLTLDSELVVYDAMGHLVYVANVDSETMILPNLNSGIYIARNGNGWAKFLVK